jgi:hypothetical protein
VLCIVVPASGQSIDTTRTISVTGVGEIQVVPDICVITAGVVLKNPSPVKVMESLATKMNEIIKVLQQAGIKKENMTTSNLQLYPVYDYQEGRQILKGYRAVENITVKSDVKDAGKILGEVVKAGANNIVGIGFDYSRRDTLELSAIELAMRDARVKAEKSLTGTSYKIKGIKSINIQSVTPVIPFVRAETMAKAASFEVPVEEGEIKIQTSVFVVFSFE